MEKARMVCQGISFGDVSSCLPVFGEWFRYMKSNESLIYASLFMRNSCRVLMGMTPLENLSNRPAAYKRSQAGSAWARGPCQAL